MKDRLMPEFYQHRFWNLPNMVFNHLYHLTKRTKEKIAKWISYRVPLFILSLKRSIDLGQANTFSILESDHILKPENWIFTRFLIKIRIDSFPTCGVALSSYHCVFKRQSGSSEFNNLIK